VAKLKNERPSSKQRRFKENCSSSSPDSAETAADHGNILLAPTMYTITEALTHGILWLHKS
jgi:hypothetical protein